MGHRDVFVVEGGLDAAAVAVQPPIPELTARVPTMTAHKLHATQDAVVIDLARSVDFRDGHIPGALWGIRSRLLALREALRQARLVVLTSPDGTLARLAVAEARGLTRAPVRVLDGGTAAWISASYALERDRTNPPDDACIDVYLRPYDRSAGVEEAMRAYLAWEIDLVHEIARDRTVRFGV
jgi:rhodanese-related sulfurtransferase